MEEELITKGICFKSVDLNSTLHAPINLTPTPFSSKAFNRANELQPAFNLLILRTIQNVPLLKSVCSKLAEGDDFVAKLYEIYLKYPSIPKFFFSINRSDYMVEGDRIFQIELNTISASLAGLSTKLSEFQRLKFENVPENRASYKIGNSLELALKLYESEYSVSKMTAILFIVQEGERNVYDQLHLLNGFDSASVKIIRKSLNDPRQFCVDPVNGILEVDGHEIGLIYYRAGYSPTEYISLEYWKSRDILESSRAIKCPDMASHLAGLKKIQQVLTTPHILLETMKQDQNIVNELRSCFAGIYSLDDTEEGAKNTEMAISDPERFVLKPQREGGGNNTYGQEVSKALQLMSPIERSTFILMDRIRPAVVNTTILRNGEKKDISGVSELGIYGVILTREDTIVLNEQVGYLLRTKPQESDEGGVVSGYSVLDVPAII